MSSTTGPQISIGAGLPSTGPGTSVPDGNPGQAIPRLPEPARAVALRAGQLCVWCLVTLPIALVLAGLGVAVIGAAVGLAFG